MNTRAKRYHQCPKKLHLPSGIQLTVSFASLRSALSSSQQQLCDCVWSDETELIQLEAVRLLGDSQSKRDGTELQWNQLSESEQQVYLEKAKQKQIEQKRKLKWIQQQYYV